MTASVIWFDEDGIMYSVPKPGAPVEQTVDEIKKEMDRFRQIIGPKKKVCIILKMDPNAPPPKRELRDLAATEIESVTKAMAIITTSPLSRMIANLFFGLKPSAYPVKMFTDVGEAKAWIKQYL